MMQSEPRRDTPRPWVRASRGAGVSVALVGTLVLLGWAIQDQPAAPIASGWDPMRPDVAFSFLLLGIALTCCLPTGDKTLQRAGWALALLALVINLVHFLQDSLGLPLGFRGLLSTLFKDLRTETFGTMPVNSLVFAATALALLVMKRTAVYSQALGILTFLIWLASLLGHLFGSHALATLGGDHANAPHTPFTGLLLSCGLLCARAGEGFMRPLVSETGAGLALRRLLPAAIAVPVVIGWSVLRGLEVHSYDPRFATALTAVLTVAVLGALLWWTAGLRSRAEEQRRAAEKAAQEQAGLYRAVVSTAVDGIITIDERAAILSLNPAAERMFGYSAQELLGQNVKVLMPEPYHSEHDGYMERYHQTGERRIIGLGREVHGRRKDGSVFPMDLAVSETRLGSRRIYTGLVRDITERKRYEVELAAAQDELRNHAARLETEVANRTASLRETIDQLETVTYSMAHDLRAPLRAMHGFSEIILEESGGRLENSSRTMLRQIGSAAQRMDRLTKDLLAYVRVARLEVKPEPIPLETVVDEALHLSPSYQQAEFNVQRPLPEVLGHRLLLLQALTNLIQNAVQYVPQDRKAKVTIRAENRNGRVRLWVEDNGPGIDPRYHQKIFGIFERIAYSTHGGTGIGLAIVSKAMRRMNGDVGLVSVPGEGSSFWIELPARKTQ